MTEVMRTAAESAFRRSNVTLDSREVQIFLYGITYNGVMQIKSLQFIGKICVVHPPPQGQYSSLMFKGREEGETSPLLPLLLVTMATLLPPFPWRLAPVLAGGVGVVVEEAGCWSFFLLILRSLARRFWNQIFTWRWGKGVFSWAIVVVYTEEQDWDKRATCRSDRLRAVASSDFLLMVMYLL